MQSYINPNDLTDAIDKMAPKFRAYQKEASKTICNYYASRPEASALIKMFCGTGKSNIMFNCDAFINHPLTLYVFPSLALVTQFYNDYLINAKADMHARHITRAQILCISSELEPTRKIQNTTNAIEIAEFLTNTAITHKFVCVTYQSFCTLLEVLDATKIVANACLFDEAHHVTGEQASQLVFGKVKYAKHIVYFTATPINANGIVMYHRATDDADMVDKEPVCGPCIYEYTYLNGVDDRWLSAFAMHIDFYSLNTTKSLYESIARTAITTGNMRVLTFHAAVNSDSDTAVRNFVNLDKFIEAYETVRRDEFPDKPPVKRIQFKGLYASVGPMDRKKILAEFDKTPDDEIFILSSCETIGEGVDTKSANMCVFVDPKQSYVKITQNIGRIVRPKLGDAKGSILIPCWVNADKYAECGGDPDARDAVIRNELLAGGDFNGILNVTSALQQEDDELFEACLKYPNCFTPKETQRSLVAQGYQIVFEYGGEEIHDAVNYLVNPTATPLSGTPVSVVSSVSSMSSIMNECETDEEILQLYANRHNVDILVHSGDLAEPVTCITAEAAEDDSDFDDFFELDDSSSEDSAEFSKERQVVRIYKFPDADDETGAFKYAPIVKKSKGGKGGKDERIYAREKLHPPKSHHKSKINIHMNDDIKVLWGVDDFETMEAKCRSCILTCKVVRTDPLDSAKAIVFRANERVANGGKLLPRNIAKKNRTAPELDQEHKDASKLGDWKKALKKGNYQQCKDVVKEYLDEKLIGWRDEMDEKATQNAKDIVFRANERVAKGGRLLPRAIYDKKNRTTPELEQENKDASKLGKWKGALKGKGHCNCSNEVKEYLDVNLIGWRDEIDLDEKAIQDAKDIVFRANERVAKGGRLLPRKISDKKNRITLELEQENKDARKLGTWKGALKGNKKYKCSNEVKVKEYLDENLPGWRDEIDLDEKAIQDAIDIVFRANERVAKGGQLLPRQIPRTTPELEQENKDANKLGKWKSALKGKGHCNCSNEVKEYLDVNLIGWRDEIDLDEKALQDANDIVFRANERIAKGERLLPKHMQKNRATPELEQENKDANKLTDWKNALKGIGRCKCNNKVKEYLDENLLGWRDVIDLDEKAMQNAKDIVFRASERIAKDGRLLPRLLTDKKNRATPELEQENKDANKLSCWKQALKGVNDQRCSNEVKEYLDENLLGWRDEIDLDEKAIQDAKDIIYRAIERTAKGMRLLPRAISDKKNRATPEFKQEHKDATKLSCWKHALKGRGHWNCRDEVKEYLDENLPGWRDEIDLDEKALQDANDIVFRANDRIVTGGRLLPRNISDKKNRTTPELEQENKDAIKLDYWKNALKGGKNSRCSDELKEYLDENLLGWRDEIDFDEKATQDAKNIAFRATERVAKGGRLLPRSLTDKKNRATPELEQEYKDAKKIGHWKAALKGSKNSRCCDKVKEYLDENLPGWRENKEEPEEEEPDPVPEPKEKPKRKRVIIEEEEDEPKPKEKPKRKRIIIEEQPKRAMALPSPQQQNPDMALFDLPRVATPKRPLPPISQLHKEYKTLHSRNLATMFKESPEKWHQYHSIAQTNDANFMDADIPRNYIIAELEKIKCKRPRMLVDMGCGMAHIAMHFKDDRRFTIKSYDHIACDAALVEACDIAHMPLEDASVEIAVICLAMWGSNCNEYIAEAHRILETDGMLYVVEPTKRWTIADDMPGDRLKQLLTNNGFKIVRESIDKFARLVCVKV